MVVYMVGRCDQSTMQCVRGKRRTGPGINMWATWGVELPVQNAGLIYLELSSLSNLAVSVHPKKK
jgi:hypothetical protein